MSISVWKLIGVMFIGACCWMDRDLAEQTQPQMLESHVFIQDTPWPRHNRHYVRSMANAFRLYVDVHERLITVGVIIVGV